jgi:hypothetical protein
MALGAKAAAPALLRYAGAGLGGGMESAVAGGAGGGDVPRAVALVGTGDGAHLRAPLSAAAGGAGARRARGSAAATAGAAWFDLPAPELTSELRRELTILRNRTFLDPKRHYKSAREDRSRALPKYFAVGTVVEGAAERLSRSSRLTHAERQPTLVDGLLADEGFNAYAGRTMDAVRTRAEAGGIKQYRERKASASADWKKRRTAFDAAQGGRKQKRKKLY